MAGSRALRFSRRFLLTTLTLCWLSGFAWGEADRTVDFVPWVDANGIPLPFTSDAEVVEFLRNAEVISQKRIKAGVNQPYKVLLELDSVQAHAVFRDVQSKKSRAEIRGMIRLGYRDDAIFEVAAYELSRLLGLRIVPPTVVREIDDKPGSLQLWVEKAMTESRRRQQKLSSPNPLQWARMRQIRFIFDELVHNDDRNLGNLLIDSDWHVWLIDHTRCFHPYARIYHLERLTHISTPLWNVLKSTPPETVRKRLVGLLTEKETDALVERWQLLVEHYSRQISELGSDRVLFTF